MKSIFGLLGALALLVTTFAPASAQYIERWQREGWKTDFSKTNIDFKEVKSGGPPKDGIPPIDNPVFVKVSEEKELTQRDPVIGLEINGDARAYPLRVLMWHEIVNDVVGGKAVAVTFCPLCNASIVFDAEVDGKTLTFGTTGKLRNSDLIMYDRTTESWWQQFSGRSITGSMTGKELKLLPARLESWASFSKRNPAGKVLIPNNPNMRNYGSNPYVGYDSSPFPFLYNGKMPEGISPMERVVVVRRADNEPIIIAMQKVREAGSLDLEGFRLSWTAGQATALGASSIGSAADVGTIIVEKKEGDALTLVPYDVTFAFVAQAFHPDTAIRK